MEKNKQPVRKTRQRLQTVHREWANKHQIKRCLTALVTENAKLKTNTSCHFFFSISLRKCEATLLMGVKTDIMLLKGNLAVCIKIETIHTLWPSNSLVSVHLQKHACAQGGPY